MTYAKLGRLEEAQIQKVVLEMSRQIIAEDHSNTLTSNLAVTY